MDRQFGADTTADQVVEGRDLTGSTLLITGASAGIGFEAARALAQAGAHVLLGCRSQSSGEDTARRLRALHPMAQVTPLTLDLASFAGIRACVERLPVERLNAVICNAGLFAPRFSTTEDGIEQTVGVCHFGHFLLVSLLLPRLRAAAPARVVMVSSESHRFPSTLRFERFPLEPSHYRALVAYGQAKLCNVLLANELTRRYSGSGVFGNSLHPGSLIGTSIFRDSISAKLLAAAARPFTKTVAQGAATTVYCATAPELAQVGGRYYADCAEKEASGGARDPEAASRLWELSMARVGL